ncbi:MAG: hypothetical protein ACRD2X_00115, partial [Vicinamibacteraceae bacterium]
RFVAGEPTGWVKYSGAPSLPQAPVGWVNYPVVGGSNADRGSQYMEASLWPAGVRGVISHQSALALRELSDVSPPAIHITVPNEFRIRRDVPAHLAVHHAELRDDEVTLFEGIPCTSVARTIEDCHRAHLGPALLRQALQDAEREGFLSPAEATDLRKRVLAAQV